MKIKMLRNPAAKFGCKLKEGETGTVDKELGERLVKLNIAEVAGDSETDQKRDVKAVPPNATVGKAESNDLNKPKR